MKRRRTLGVGAIASAGALKRRTTVGVAAIASAGALKRRTTVGVAAIASAGALLLALSVAGIGELDGRLQAAERATAVERRLEAIDHRVKPDCPRRQTAPDRERL